MFSQMVVLHGDDSHGIGSVKKLPEETKKLSFNIPEVLGYVYVYLLQGEGNQIGNLPQIGVKIKHI